MAGNLKSQDVQQSEVHKKPEQPEITGFLKKLALEYQGTPHPHLEVIPDYHRVVEIGIDQHNGHGLGVFRIITATKVRLMDPELKKTTIAKGPDRSSNMTEEYAS